MSHTIPPFVEQRRTPALHLILAGMKRKIARYVQLGGFVNQRLRNVAEKVFLQWFLFVSRGQIKGYKASKYLTKDEFFCISSGFSVFFFFYLKKEPRGFFSI
jgi:hypothetical protein